VAVALPTLVVAAVEHTVRRLAQAVQAVPEAAVMAGLTKPMGQAVQSIAVVVVALLVELTTQQVLCPVVQAAQA
jgi:hypothetical protein